MKTLIPRLTLLPVAFLLTSPAQLRAHAGHAGDHGWLAGAVQPLLSLDHFLAGLFVAVLGGLGSLALARRRATRRGVHTT